MDGGKTIQQAEQEIIDDFSLLNSWDEDQKYEYVIDLGKRLPELDARHKTADNVVKGCQSTVWLMAEYKEGKVFYNADSNSTITKGLISMLIQVLSGHTPDEIINSDLAFIRAIGMSSHFAQTRSNGLLAMVKQMKNYALAFKIKSSTSV